MNSLKGKKPNWLGLNLEASFFITDESDQRFLRFVEALFVWSDGLYAFSCHRNEFDQQNRLPRPTMIRGKLIATASYPIIGCLPGVYWTNIFGAPYINWFGYERIVSAPGYSIKEFGNGAVMILAGKSPLHYSTYQAVEEGIRKHLGEQAFFDIENPTRACDSPFDGGIPRP
jgi:hypothetical protein